MLCGELNGKKIPKEGIYVNRGLPRGHGGKEFSCQYRRHRFNPWAGKIPWNRNWQPTPVLLAWRIPWTEEPNGLQSMRSQRVRHCAHTRVNVWLVYVAIQEKLTQHCKATILQFQKIKRVTHRGGWFDRKEEWLGYKMICGLHNLSVVCVASTSLWNEPYLL